MPLSFLPYRPSHCRPTCAVRVPSLRSPELSIAITPRACGAVAAAFTEPEEGSVHVVEAFSRNGLRFTVWDEGPVDAETVVLLHGFPQSAQSWIGVSRPLLAAGYRVIAPDQRGYTPQARPRPRRAYRLNELVADVMALVDTAGVDRVHLVGHDWGGGIAWMVAATRPDRLHTLTVVSAPHPRAVVNAMLTSRQLLRAWHVGFFQLPWLPEAGIRSRG